MEIAFWIFRETYKLRLPHPHIDRTQPRGVGDLVYSAQTRRRRLLGACTTQNIGTVTAETWITRSTLKTTSRVNLAYLLTP